MHVSIHPRLPVSCLVVRSAAIGIASVWPATDIDARPQILRAEPRLLDRDLCLLQLIPPRQHLPQLRRQLARKVMALPRIMYLRYSRTRTSPQAPTSPPAHRRDSNRGRFSVNDSGRVSQCHQKLGVSNKRRQLSPGCRGMAEPHRGSSIPHTDVGRRARPREAAMAGATVSGATNHPCHGRLRLGGP
jgi:hypothetical protein